MSTLAIDFRSLHGAWIQQGYQIACYQFPDVHAQKGKNPKVGYVRLQNWLKENVLGCYHYQQWGRMLFCLLAPGASAQTLRFDEVELVPEMLDAAKVSRSHQEPFLNLMLAEYLQSHGKFVSNERYFIYVEPIRDKQYAVAMSLQIRRTQSPFSKGQGTHHFTIVSRVMRFRCVPKESYENKWKRKKVPYALDFSNEMTIRLRQLRPIEVGAHQGDLYILKSNRKNKVSVPFLSLEGTEKLHQCRLGLVGRFIQDFVDYLQKKRLDARQEKLHYQSVALPENRLQQLMDGFQFQVLDCRLRRETPLSEIIGLSSIQWLQNAPIHHDASTFVADIPVLLWMDVKPSADENAVEEVETYDGDPYKQFKASYSQVASQGFCMSELLLKSKSIEGLGPEHAWTANQVRKLEISLRQLLLKQIILHPEMMLAGDLLPTSLNNKVFLSYVPSKDEKKAGRFITFAIEGALPRLREFKNCTKLRNYIQKITGNEKIDAQWEKMCPSESGLSSEQIVKGQAFEPFVTMWKRLKAVIFDARGVLKIELPSEYALYDYECIYDRLHTREKRRPVEDFLPRGDSEVHRRLESFFKENIHERHLSYNELRKRYGQGEGGFFMLIPGPKNERPYLQLLKTSNDLEIPGIKSGGLFDIHQGVWFNNVERKYFVGKMQGLKQYGQPYGFPIRWINVRYGFRFDESEFFDWLDKEFVREKEMTVLPLPFTLIRMRSEMTR